MIRARLYLGLLIGIFSGSALAESRPIGHIVDPKSTLPLQLSKGLERVLDQHEQLLGDTIFVVLSDQAGEDAEEKASALFESWKLDTVDPTKAVLILFQTTDRQVALRAGIGMEAFLSAFPLERVAEKTFRAELSHGSPERGVVLSVLEVLNVLAGPSVAEAQSILEEAGFPGEFIPRPRKNQLPLWPFLLGIGLLGFGYVLWIALSGEAHYSSEGWVRVRHFVPPFLKRAWKRTRGGKAPALVTGGGVSGSW